MTLQAFALELEQEHGKLDCLVNNAGFAFKVYSACGGKLTCLDFKSFCAE
jgi:NAD(P)-dependent dehydrogenase (short-subunit alcohol dehydrogenase family)